MTYVTNLLRRKICRPFADDTVPENAITVSHYITRLSLALLTVVNVMDAIIFDIDANTVVCYAPCITANLI